MAQHDIFLSYARSDGDVAEAFVKAWRARGRTVWYDGMIPSGANWRKDITAAIQASRIHLVLFSANSNRSDQIIKEISIADRSHIPIIPVQIEENIVPVGEYAFELGHRQWITLAPNPQGRIGELVEKLMPLLGGEGGDVSQTKAAKETSPAKPTPLSPVAQFGLIVLNTALCLALVWSAEFVALSYGLPFLSEHESRVALASLLAVITQTFAFAYLEAVQDWRYTVLGKPLEIIIALLLISFIFLEDSLFPINFYRTYIYLIVTGILWFFARQFVRFYFFRYYWIYRKLLADQVGPRVGREFLNRWSVQDLSWTIPLFCCTAPIIFYPDSFSLVFILWNFFLSIVWRSFTNAVANSDFLEAIDEYASIIILYLCIFVSFILNSIDLYLGFISSITGLVISTNIGFALLIYFFLAFLALVPLLLACVTHIFIRGLVR